MNQIKRTIMIILSIVVIGLFAVTLLPFHPGEAARPASPAGPGSALEPTGADQRTAEDPGQPLAFVENLGQWDEQVLYQMPAYGGAVWVTQEAVWVSYLDPQALENLTLDPGHLIDPVTGLPDEKLEEGVPVLNIKISFPGSSLPMAVPSDQQEGVMHYFQGGDPQKWKSNAGMFSELTLPAIYPGIDLHLRETRGILGLVLHHLPGADLSKIRMKVEGADSVGLDDRGFLSAVTPFGDLPLPTFLQADGSPMAMVITQEVSPRPIQMFLPQIQGEFIHQVVSLETRPALEAAAAITQANSSSVGYSHYLGGSATDRAYGISKTDAIATGLEWDIFAVTGVTHSPDFPTDFGIGSMAKSDIFVTSTDSAGGTAIIGGKSSDVGYGVYYKSIGFNTEAIYVTGSTLSPDFPASDSGGTHSAKKMDGFILRLRFNSFAPPEYDSLLISGSAKEIGYDVSDCDDNSLLLPVESMCVTGYTNSVDLPASGAANTLQGTADGFLARFEFSDMGNPGMDPVFYATHLHYLGGSGVDYGTAIEGLRKASTVGPISPAYMVSISGVTSSNDLLVSSGAFDQTYNGGEDGFLWILGIDITSPFSASAVWTDYLSYFGGSGNDRPEDLVIQKRYDPITSLYVGENHLVTGSTSSLDFPNTVNQMLGGSDDAFYIGLKGNPSPPGVDFLGSAYVGGNGSDFGRAITSWHGYAILAGDTKSQSGFDPPFSNSFSGLQDGFVTTLDINGNHPGGISLLYGGSKPDSITGVVETYDRYNGIDGLMIVGYTNSVNLPLADNALSGGQDGFVTYLVIDGCVTPPAGMQAWWSGDQEHAPALDLTSNHNDGVLHGAVLDQAGMVAGAFKLDGVDDYIQVPDSPSLNFYDEDDFSIDFWVNIDPSQNTPGVYSILDKRAMVGNTPIGYHMFIWQGKPGIQLADGSGSGYGNYAANAMIADGHWHFITVTLEGGQATRRINFYSTVEASHPKSLANLSPLIIGKRSIDNTGYLKAWIDELEIFHQVLSEDEIRWIYNASGYGKCKP
jgi:hypothetical protein